MQRWIRWHEKLLSFTRQWRFVRTRLGRCVTVGVVVPFRKRRTDLRCSSKIERPEMHPVFCAFVTATVYLLWEQKNPLQTWRFWKEKGSYFFISFSPSLLIFVLCSVCSFWIPQEENALCLPARLTLPDPSPVCVQNKALFSLVCFQSVSLQSDTKPWWLCVRMTRFVMTEAILTLQKMSRLVPSFWAPN